jgi:hypothetical protein
MCDGLAVCDDAVNLGPTESPTDAPGSGGNSIIGLFAYALGGATTISLLWTS